MKCRYKMQNEKTNTQAVILNILLLRLDDGLEGFKSMAVQIDCYILINIQLQHYYQCSSDPITTPKSYLLLCILHSYNLFAGRLNIYLDSQKVFLPFNIYVYLKLKYIYTFYHQYFNKICDENKLFTYKIFQGLFQPNLVNIQTFSIYNMYI